MICSTVRTKAAAPSAEKRRKPIDLASNAVMVLPIASRRALRSAPSCRRRRRRFMIHGHGDGRGAASSRREAMAGSNSVSPLSSRKAPFISSRASQQVAKLSVRP